jgi:hypothetical protein
LRWRQLSSHRAGKGEWRIGNGEWGKSSSSLFATRHFAIRGGFRSAPPTLETKESRTPTDACCYRSAPLKGVAACLCPLFPSPACGGGSGGGTPACRRSTGGSCGGEPTPPLSSRRTSWDAFPTGVTRRFLSQSSDPFSRRPVIVPAGRTPGAARERR